jgi:hypothetical protein
VTVAVASGYSGSGGVAVAAKWSKNERNRSCIGRVMDMFA